MAASSRARNLDNGLIGDVLLELRRGRGQSQDQLADRVGVSRQTLATWERNQASPGLDAVIRLARALEVRLNVFFPADPVGLPPPGWETLARRLPLSYDDALRLRSLLLERGIAETATIEEALLVWMREQKVL